MLPPRITEHPGLLPPRRGTGCTLPDNQVDDVSCLHARDPWVACEMRMDVEGGMFLMIWRGDNVFGETE